MAPSSPAPEATVSPQALVYEDLRLLIEGSGRAGEYTASIVESPAGESSAPETIRWSATPEMPEKERDVRKLGASMFGAFFAGEIRELYRESCARTSAKLTGLRIKLLIDPPELCGAPWELLYDERNRRYVGLSSRTPIVRHARIPQAIEPLIVQPPLRVLGVIASPLDPRFPPLDLERERALVESALADLRVAGLVELTWLVRGTWEELQQAMWQGWHVVHFCGHGDFDAAAGEGYLVFENAEGRAHRLPAAHLGLLLREQGNVRLAILNACKGAVGDTSTSSASVAGALMHAGLGGVVAMQNSITDQAALTFARVTYLAIASGLPLEAAVSSARVAMALEHATPIEWWTPVLHMRSRDGTLFDVPSVSPDAHPEIKGTEYLGPDLDRRLEKELARRRRRSRLLSSFILAPIPLSAVLAVAPVSSPTVTAAIEAAGATFVLASEREVFRQLPRLQSLTASGLSHVLAPGSAFPLRPGPDQEALVTAEAADNGSWISLQPWMLPAGARLTWDHPPGADPGEYLLSLSAAPGQRLNLGLAHRIRLSRFRSAPVLHDYGDNAPLQIVSAAAPLELTMRFRQPADLTTPSLAVESLELVRTWLGDEGPQTEHTVLNAHLHYAGRDTVLGAMSLALQGLHAAAVDDLRLIDRGLAFTVTGSAQHVVIGGNVVPVPSRLEHLIEERPLYLVLGALAYVLIIVTALISWRTSHGSRLA